MCRRSISSSHLILYCYILLYRQLVSTRRNSIVPYLIFIDLLQNVVIITVASNIFFTICNVYLCATYAVRCVGEGRLSETNKIPRERERVSCL